MSPERSLVTRVRLLILAFGAMGSAAQAGPFSLVSGSEQLTAVSSKVFAGYVRARNPDGSYRTETYAFGNGGLVSASQPGADTAGVEANGGSGEGVVSDPTIDDMSFGMLSRTVARPLAEQNYVPTHDPNAANLLIMVYWGRSLGSARILLGPMKDVIDAQNAQLMGFDSERIFRTRIDASTVFFGRSFRSTILDNVHADLISAIEMDRYYVVLRAFDFQTAWKRRRIRLLWETRFSLSERQHDFGKELPTMAHTASKYFGQDTDGLIRASIPEGSVEIGDVKSLGNVPEK
jgi:hypothetical protein